MLVGRSMTSDDGVFIPFPSNFIFCSCSLLNYLSMLFFQILKSAKGWSTGSKIFRMFFFLWCGYCVRFPWVSEFEIEIAVTKTNCNYTASSKVVQD